MHHVGRWCGFLAALAFIVSGCSQGVHYEADARRVANWPNQQSTEALQRLAAVEEAAMYGQATRTAATTFDFVSPTDEVWIIAQPPRTTAAPPPDHDTPGAGALLCFPPASSTEFVPLPLEHTAVSADILGHIAAVRVTQRFQNPFDTKIEAVYAFPLPEDAAVNEFIMSIGDRRIRGVIRERDEAIRLYEQAKSHGHRASLLTQERPNVFTQKVANIEPGKRIDVDLRYFHTLSYSDGWYTWVFPTTIGPRFNPPGTPNPIMGVPLLEQSFRVPDPNATTIPYLAPTQRSAHDLSLDVSLDAGVAIEALDSPSHRIDANGDASRQRIRLADADTTPNQDFILRFRVAGDRIKSSLITCASPNAGPEPATSFRGAAGEGPGPACGSVHSGDSGGSGGGGYFTLTLHPPADLASLPRRPIELVFVLDCSGSMNGKPLAQAKAAVRDALRRLTPGDTFQIIRFSDRTSALGDRPRPATPANLADAVRYLDALHSEGGTVMLTGVKAVFDIPRDPERDRIVSFLTDGFIGNEDDVLRAIDERIDASNARIFSFGVGSAPNRHLLAEMARAGRGAVAYLAPGDDAPAVMAHFLQRAARPALTDLSFDWNGASVADVFPRNVPDLFVGRPVVLTGRYLGEPPRSVRVTGRAAGAPVEFTVTAPDNGLASVPALAALWARTKIADLTAAQRRGDPHGDLAHAIRTLALDHNLVSPYTAFLAVDATERTAGTFGVTVPQALPVPTGVRYHTTVR